MFRTLLALLLVLSRLVAPAMAAPQAGGVLTEFDRLARESICHVAADEAGDPASDAPAGQGNCLLCPACHLAAAALLPVPAGPVLPVPGFVAIGLSAPPPPATGPPTPRRAAAPPTGPPFLSA